MATYRLTEGSLQQRFNHSHAKIQVFAGGFANGKTAAGVIKAIQLAKDYPGSNGLIARATYPKLNDTIRKEFLKWCPAKWIKSFPRSQNASNTCTLTNGTDINFRYIVQQGKNSPDATTSNLLSATYDWIVVDQIEDPGIVHKDFLDLLGRLRGSTRYTGDDPSMPRSGPRWMIITTNPTRGWVYKRIVAPFHAYKKGRVHPDLLCEREANGRPRIVSGYPIPIVDIFEGSTYENKDNLEPDYIATLEATYTGQMRERFLLGRWSAYEGLVYSEYSPDIHQLPHHKIEDYLRNLRTTHKEITFLEGFDHGIAVPSCYLFGFCDGSGNVFVIDGFYSPELSPEAIGERVKAIRRTYRCNSNKVWSDPDVFRRKGSTTKTVGKSIAELLHGEGLYCVRGNSDISNGIIKIKQYLIPQRFHIHPLTGQAGSPYLFFSDKLDFVEDEITAYYWMKDSSGEPTDNPVDKDDHAMDTLKYMLSERPVIATLITDHPAVVNYPKSWSETRDGEEDHRRYRYG